MTVDVPSQRLCEAAFALYDQFLKIVTGPAAAIVKDGVIFNLYCFSEEADAEKFRVRFNALKFDPTWRGRGDAKNRWVGGR